MLGVFGKRHPFQVFWAIVCLYAVYVVDRQMFLVTWHKCQSNKPVDKRLSSLVTVLYRYLKVSRFCFPRGDLFLRRAVGVALLNPVARSCYLGGFFWRKNCSVSLNQPIFAL